MKLEAAVHGRKMMFQTGCSTEFHMIGREAEVLCKLKSSEINPAIN